ncbi:unnamed protein product, partial [Closterium sp. NIES-54]
GPYSSQWQAAMDAEMASWKSTGTYVNEVPPPGANIVSGMWIFRVKRPPGSPPVFKARYVARGFSQRQGVDFFQTFSPTPKMTTLRVLLHVTAQRDYELHSLEFRTAFLQGSLHEEIWLHRPPGFTGSFPAGTQWSLRRPVYGLRQAPREWHDTLKTTVAALGFAPSTSDPSLFLCTDTTLPPFYVLVYVDDLVFATADIKALAHVLQHFGFTYSSPQSTPLPTGHSLLAPPSDESVEPSGPYPELVGCLMYLMTCTRHDLAYPLSLLARYVAPGRHRMVRWDATKRVLRYLCSTSGMGLMLGGRARVVLTGHADASLVDDLTTQRSSKGYTFSLGSGSVSWRSTRSSSVLNSSCEAEIYAGAMAAQELRWLTYLLIDLGEAPRSPPVLYVDNKAMLALCQEHRLEHRTKHIALRYFLARELQQRGQLRLAYVASQANTADVSTNALQPCDLQRSCTVLSLLLRSGVDMFALDYDAIHAAMYALSVSAEGDCYLYVPPDQGIEAGALGASESALPGTAPAKALHTFTLDSGASCCFFLNSFTLIPLTAPIHVKLVDPSGGPVLERSTTILPCLAVPSRSLSGLHLPSFSTNLVSTAALQDAMVTTTTTGGQRVAIYTSTRTGRHLATFTCRPGSSLYTLSTELAQVAASSQVSASGLVAPLCSCRLLSHHTLLWHHRLGHPSLPRLHGMHSRLLDVLIPSIRAVHLRLRERFREDLPALRLHSDRGAELSSDLLWDFCRGEGILQSFTLPASQQKNGVANRCIGLVMEVVCTSMIHVASPHFLWPFADVTFDESVPFYCLFPYRTAPLSPPAPLFLAPGPPPVDPFSPQGLAPSGVSQVDPLPLATHVKVTVDSGAAGGGAARGPASGGAEPAGAELGGAEPASAEHGAAEPEGAEPEGAETEGAEPGGAEPRGTASGAARAGGPTAGGTGAGGAGGTSPGGAGFTAGAGGTRGAGAAGPGGACIRGTGAVGAIGVGGAGAGGAGAGDLGAGGTRDPGARGTGAGDLGAGVLGAGGTGARGAGARGAGAGGSGAGGAGARGAGAGGAGVGGTEAGGVGDGDPEAGGADAGGAGADGTGAGGTVQRQPFFVPPLPSSLPPLGSVLRQPDSPLPAPSPYTKHTDSLTKRREPKSRPVSHVRTVRTGHRVPRLRPPPVPGTHIMALCPSSVPQRFPLASPPASSLADGPDPESDLVRAASPTVTRHLATVDIDPSFEYAAASALVAELVDFVAACRLNYAANLVPKSESDCPPSVRGECALGMDVFEDRQEEFECLAVAVPNLVAMLLAPEGDPNAPDIQTPRSYVEAITGPYSSQWQTAMDAEMASWKSTGTYVDGVPPPRAPREWHDTLRMTLAALGSAPSTADPLLFLRTDTSLLPFYILVYVNDLVFASPHIEALALVRSELQKRHTCTDLGELHSYLGFQITRDRARHTITLTQSHMVHQVLQRFSFRYSSPQSTPLPTGHSLSAPPWDESVEPSGPYSVLVGCLVYLMTCTRPDLAYPLSILARYVALRRHRPENWEAAKRVLRYLCSTSGMGLVLGGRGLIVLTGHADVSWVEDLATQRSSQGYTFSLRSDSVSWGSTRSSSVLSSSCEAEIFAGAMAAQELR